MKPVGLININTNLLLTEREGRTGEYWPEVVTVRTERSEVRTKTTEGQYSPRRPEQARLVSSLLYGTLFPIVKCNFWWLALKKRSSSSSIFEISEKVIFLASAGSFNVKNDNFHTFFFQAEDGIRDPLWSRGLGDVYKRQVSTRNYAAMQTHYYDMSHAMKW